jgi:hypothetical protein
MQREFIETDPEKLALLLGHDESRSPTLALPTPSGRWQKVPEANKSDRNMNWDPGSMLRGCRAFWLSFICPLLSVFQVRNSLSDSCDIALKAITDLAKIRKSHVTFSAFNSIKITSV